MPANRCSQQSGLNGPKVMVIFQVVAVTFLQMEYFYLLRFSGFVFICDFFFNYSFNIIFPAFCLSLLGGVMSESVQSWLYFCYYCCVSMW